MPKGERKQVRGDVRISVVMPAELWARVILEAGRDGCPVSEVVAACIEAVLEPAGVTPAKGAGEK